MAFKIEQDTGIWKPFFLDGACVRFSALRGRACRKQCDHFGAKLAQEILVGREWRPGVGLEFRLTAK